MKFSILFFSLFFIGSCTTPHTLAQSNPTDESKTWNIKKLLLTQKADSLWYFKKKRGKIIKNLGVWKSVKMLCQAIDLEYWILDGTDDEFEYMYEEVIDIGNAEQNFFFITQDTSGQNFIIYADQLTRPYQLALSLEEVSKTTEVLCLIRPKKDIFDHKFWETTHPNINSLLVVFSGLDSIPKGITSLTNLNRLDWIYSPIKSLPKEMANLQQLQKLNFTSCFFHKTPKILGQLSNLKALDFTMNPLIELDSSIGNLKNLEYLDLSFTSSYNGLIPSLPKELQNLTKLRYFYFYQPEELTESLLQDLKQLKKRLPRCTLGF
ncbi:MAG: leucine-rich repeat domain-containing protein [Aureispira sp.]|nr:leucine-rich repeat domain-containing protein [Aureispira sp.]